MHVAALPHVRRLGNLPSLQAGQAWGTPSRGLLTPSYSLLPTGRGQAQGLDIPWAVFWLGNSWPTSVFPLPLCPHLCRGFTACFSPLRVRYTAQPCAQVWSGSGSGEAARVLTSASGGNPAVTEACALGLAGPVTSNTAALESHRVCHRVHSLP